MKALNGSSYHWYHRYKDEIHVMDYTSVQSRSSHKHWRCIYLPSCTCDYNRCKPCIALKHGCLLLRKKSYLPLSTLMGAVLHKKKKAPIPGIHNSELSVPFGFPLSHFDGIFSWCGSLSYQRARALYQLHPRLQSLQALGSFETWMPFYKGRNPIYPSQFLCLSYHYYPQTAMPGIHTYELSIPFGFPLSLVSMTVLADVVVWASRGSCLIPVAIAIRIVASLGWLWNMDAFYYPQTRDDSFSWCGSLS